ncbi:MAG: membrane-bound PQQ-dependent dehydrogenase, glucose/quinate/shikimate family, partial [Brevundimonas sp.]
MPIRSPASPGAWAVAALGVVLVLLGLVLTGGGIWLISLGGSWYYALAGLGLIASGALLTQTRIEGLYVYAAVFAVTLLWSLWEVGLDGWGLVPRLVGPVVLLALALASLPVLLKRRGTGKIAGFSLAGLAVVTVAFSVLVANAHPLNPPPLPAANAVVSSDPDAIPVGADWAAYGGSYHAQRYSTLNQITPENVGKLERAWSIHTGDLPGDRPGAQNKYASENTPLKVGNTLYICTGKSMVVAADAATGRQLWKSDPQVDDKSIPYTAACRGVSYYTVPGANPADPCASRIIWGTLDARLIAVDARTGQRCAGFGQGGQVDTSANMGQLIPGMVSI